MIASFYAEGRVDAILLACEGHYAFIDAGYRADGISCVKRMRARGIDHLDIYIATHRHRNHVGGAPYIIRAMRPDVIYTADARMKSRLRDLCQNAAERAALAEAKWSFADAIDLGSAHITRVGPARLRACSAGALAENENSQILRVDYGKWRILLTGDTSAAVLRQIPADELRADVLKNPHHGGNLPVDVLRAIAPNVTVLCTNVKCSSKYRKTLATRVYTACKSDGGSVHLRFDSAGIAVQRGALQ